MSDLAKLFIIIIIKKVKIIVTLSIKNTAGALYKSQIKGENDTNSGVGTYLSGTARAVPLLKVGRLVMHFAVPLFGHRLHISQ